MIQIKEEFVGCDKYDRALDLGGSDTIVMWLALKRYVSANLTGGFVPDEDIDKLPGRPKRHRKALEWLVACGRLSPGGEQRGAGLVERSTAGWQLHDYDDHANTADEERLRKEKARVKKAAQRAAKKAELDRLLASQGQSRGRPRGQTQHVPQGQHSGHSGARPPAHVHAHEPNPTQPNQQKPPPPKDLIRSGDVRPLTEDEAGFKVVSAGEKAALILEGAESAEVLKPHNWQEIRDLVGDFAQITGVEQKILPYEHDPGVRALVVLLAAFDIERLRAVLPIVLGTDFWRAVPARPLSHLSRAVVDQALAEDAEAAKVEAARLAQLQRHRVPRKATLPPGLMNAADLAQAALEQARG